MDLDQLTESALDLGSPNVVVMTREDLDRVLAVVYRAGEEGFLTEEERFAFELIRTREWTCPGAVKVSV